MMRKIAIAAAISLFSTGNFFANDDVSREEVIRVLTQYVNPWVSSRTSEAARKELIEKLRGLKSDGTYEYASWNKTGNRVVKKKNFDLDDNEETIRLEVNSPIYKIRLVSPESGGLMRDNKPVTVKEYSIDYKPLGATTMSAMNEQAGWTIQPQGERVIELDNVGNEVRFVAQMQHNSRGFMSTDPNIIVEFIGATFQDDPNNPNAELLDYANQGNREALASLGVDIMEIPPAKSSFGFQPTIPDELDIQEMKAALREARNLLDDAGSESGAVDYIHQRAGDQLTVAGRYAQSNRKVSSRINEIKRYIEFRKDGQPSPISRAYAINMINDIINTDFYYHQEPTTGHDSDYKEPGYGDIKDDGYGGGYDDGSDYKDDDYGSGSDYKYDGPVYDSDIKDGNDTGSDYKDDGPSTSSPRTIRTYLGNRRYDNVSRGTAIDEKSGRQSLSQSARDQIEKDIEVMDDPSNAVEMVEWHFLPNRNGESGPTESLRSALRSAGIRIVEPRNSGGFTPRPPLDSYDDDDLKGGGSSYDDDLK